MEKNPGKPISKDEFKKMRKAYKDKNPDKTQAVHFGADSVKRVLDSPGAAGLRVYFGEDSDGNNTVMLMAVDADGIDLQDATIEDYGQLCPPFCNPNGTE